jgi:hypothetical protein
MKITREKLFQKLKALDERLLQIWIDDNIELNDDERWEIFVMLLEARVNLLTTCRDAGVKLSPELCMPRWLETLTSSRKELRLRDLRLLYEELRQKKTIKAYEDVAKLKGESADP